MDVENSKKRIAEIVKRQSAFDGRIAGLDESLALMLIENAEKVLENPAVLTAMLREFEKKDYLTFLRKFGSDILAIERLNADYFRETVNDQPGTLFINLDKFNEATEAVNTQLTARFGIRPDGKIISDGAFDSFAQDTTVRRQLQQFAYKQKAADVGITEFKKSIKAFVKGIENNPNAPKTGIYTRYLNTFTYDTYQQVDRAAQDGFSKALGLSAFLFLGGIIAGSRTWCRLRDGKCFLRSEIAKFGTAQDTYGGYENKAIGYFLGKTKVNYQPFTDLGGYGCRHHLSAIANREALKRRSDLRLSELGILLVA